MISGFCSATMVSFEKACKPNKEWLKIKIIQQKWNQMINTDIEKVKLIIHKV